MPEEEAAGRKDETAPNPMATVVIPTQGTTTARHGIESSLPLPPPSATIQGMKMHATAASSPTTAPRTYTEVKEYSVASQTPSGRPTSCANPMANPNSPDARPKKRLGTSSATSADSATVKAPNPMPRKAERASTNGASSSVMCPSAGTPSMMAAKTITGV